MNTFIYNTVKLISERLPYEDIQSQKQLRRFEVGARGEKKVYETFRKFTYNQPLITDYTFELDGRTAQLDLLVITSGVLHVIEVKNYEADFYYEDGRGYFAGSKDHMNSDIMQSFERRLYMLDEIVKKTGLSFRVNGIMIFANPNARLFIDYNSVKRYDFEILEFDQLESYLRRNADGFKRVIKKEVSELSKALAFYEYRGFRYFPKEIGEETYNSMKKGVACYNCRFIGLKVKQRHFHCLKCGSLEAKSKALIRSARELRTIFYHDEYVVTTRKLLEFMDGGIHKNRAGKILKRVFKKNKLGKYTSYLVEPLRGESVLEEISKQML